MTFVLKVQIVGDLKRIMAAEVKAGAAATEEGVKAAGEGAKADWQNEIRRAGLGNKLPNTIRARLYPNKGQAGGPATLIWTKAPKLLRVFESGATIRSKGGRFLALPTLAAPARGTDGKRINPGNFPEGRLGKLRFVKRPGRNALLVVDGLVKRGQRAFKAGKRGGFRAATVRKATKARGAFVSLKGATTVVMFTLQPQVHLKKRLDIAPIALRWHRRLPMLIADRWNINQNRGS
jgi:hypothetical protein